MPRRKPKIPAKQYESPLTRANTDSSLYVADGPGRPPTLENWKWTIRRAVDAASAKDPSKSKRQAIVERVVALAERGVPWAVEFLANREDGKPRQIVDLEARRSPLEGISDAEIRAALDKLGKMNKGGGGASLDKLGKMNKGGGGASASADT